MWSGIEPEYMGSVFGSGTPTNLTEQVRVRLNLHSGVRRDKDKTGTINREEKHKSSVQNAGW